LPPVGAGLLTPGFHHATLTVFASTCLNRCQVCILSLIKFLISIQVLACFGYRLAHAAVPAEVGRFFEEAGGVAIWIGLICGVSRDGGIGSEDLAGGVFDLCCTTKGWNHLRASIVCLFLTKIC